MYYICIIYVFIYLFITFIYLSLYIYLFIHLFIFLFTHSFIHFCVSRIWMCLLSAAEIPPSPYGNKPCSLLRTSSMISPITKLCKSEYCLYQYLSQDSETWCPKLAIITFLGFLLSFAFLVHLNITLEFL